MNAISDAGKSTKRVSHH